jgi:hypothetical protein
MKNDTGTEITWYAMQIMARTFLRTTELREAPWVELDLDGGWWEIPKDRMKMLGDATTLVMALSANGSGKETPLSRKRGDFLWVEGQRSLLHIKQVRSSTLVCLARECSPEYVRGKLK